MHIVGFIEMSNLIGSKYYIFFSSAMLPCKWRSNFFIAQDGCRYCILIDQMFSVYRLSSCVFDFLCFCSVVNKGWPSLSYMQYINHSLDINSVSLCCHLISLKIICPSRVLAPIFACTNFLKSSLFLESD